LFAAHIAILWVAVAFTKKLAYKYRLAAFTILAILVYLSHGYLFFFLALPLLAFFFYDAFSHKNKESAVLAIVQIALLLAAAANTASNSSLPRDLTYSMGINACAMQDSILLKHKDYEQKWNVPYEFLGGIYSKFFSIVPIGYFIPLLSNPAAIIAILICLIALILKLASAFASEKLDIPNLRLPQINFNKKYLALTAYSYAHFLFVPFSAASIYFLNERSIPFITAFAALSFSHKKLDSLIPKILTAIVVASLIFQAAAFYMNIPAQQKIIDKAKIMAQELPQNSTVMIFSAEWNSRVYTPLLPVQANPEYNALLLIYNPYIYESNMFLFQDTFLLRSNFPIFDEFRIWYSSDKPLDDLIYKDCYAPIPKEFDYYIDRNMTLMKNPNAANKGK
ncbi:MAG: hypothetical protein V1822_04075, partial [Candidatus Micrarchaeota archaeon]